MPPENAYLVRWFNQIGRARALHEWGFAPISWAEIDAWSRLMRIQPDPWEIDALLRLDRAWLKIMGEKTYSFEDDPDDGD